MPLHVSRCDDTRGCIVQFWPPDDEHICSKHIEAWNKLIIKFSASSWLILGRKEEHWFSCTAIILTSSHGAKPQCCWWLAPAKPVSRQNHCLIYSSNGKASESVGLAVDRSWWRAVCWNDQLCPLLCLCIWLQGTKSQKPQENTEQ